MTQVYHSGRVGSGIHIGRFFARPFEPPRAKKKIVSQGRTIGLVSFAG